MLFSKIFFIIFLTISYVVSLMETTHPEAVSQVNLSLDMFIDPCAYPSPDTVTATRQGNSWTYTYTLPATREPGIYDVLVNVLTNRGDNGYQLIPIIITDEQVPDEPSPTPSAVPSPTIVCDAIPNTVCYSNSDAVCGFISNTVYCTISNTICSSISNTVYCTIPNAVGSAAPNAVSDAAFNSSRCWDSTDDAYFFTIAETFTHTNA